MESNFQKQLIEMCGLSKIINFQAVQVVAEISPPWHSIEHIKSLIDKSYAAGVGSERKTEFIDGLCGLSFFQGENLPNVIGDALQRLLSSRGFTAGENTISVNGVTVRLINRVEDSAASLVAEQTDHQGSDSEFSNVTGHRRSDSRCGFILNLIKSDTL